MITRDDVEYVANLARLILNEQEIEKMTDELGAIIEFANSLSELDTKDVDPTAHVFDIYNVFRDDEVKPSFSREDILKNAPSHDDACIKVPKVVE